MTNPFTNRIIGYGTKAADQFEANPLNYRTHPERQRKAVQASLRELGWIGVVVENKTTGRLIDGHERVWQALKQNEDVPYIEVELSEAEEKLALAIFDPITYMAETDGAILDALLRDVNTGESALQELLAGLAADAGLYGDKPEVQDVAPQVDKAEELRQKWQVETGQLWQLGDHRLICGDCTDAEVVAGVMGGEKAALAIADPPYNVGYEYDSISDQMSREDYGAWCGKFLGLMCQHSDMQIVTPGKSNERLYEPREWLTWYKGFSLSLGHFFKSMVTEPILLFGKKPTNKFYSTDYFDFATERERGLLELHTCPKPIALWRALIEPMTDMAQIVYEPFSGSGTTIIACEQLGRKCRAVEISPAYVAVALQRWADATGKTPVLVE